MCSSVSFPGERTRLGVRKVLAWFQVGVVGGGGRDVTVVVQHEVSKVERGGVVSLKRTQRSECRRLVWLLPRPTK